MTTRRRGRHGEGGGVWLPLLVCGCCGGLSLSLSPFAVCGFGVEPFSSLSLSLCVLYTVSERSARQMVDSAAEWSPSCGSAHACLWGTTASAPSEGDFQQERFSPSVTHPGCSPGFGRRDVTAGGCVPTPARRRRGRVVGALLGVREKTEKLSRRGPAATGRAGRPADLRPSGRLQVF